MPHPIHPRGAFGQRPSRTRLRLLAMLLSAGCDITLDAPLLIVNGFQLITSIIGSNCSLSLAAWGHRLSYDQLQRRLDGRLRIVSLHETVGALHDARFRIVEVVLILVLWPGLLSTPPCSAAFCPA